MLVAVVQVGHVWVGVHGRCVLVPVDVPPSEPVGVVVVVVAVAVGVLVLVVHGHMDVLVLV